MMTPLDRQSPVPLYFQLKQVLLEKIRRGDWTPGTLIPSEQELQDGYQLSRTTVRQTLSELVTEGHLMRQRGRGTFITQPKIAYDPSLGIRANEYLDTYGVALGWSLIDHGFTDAPDDAALSLNLTNDVRVYRVQRVRVAGADPIGYHIAYTPPQVAAHIDHDRLVTGESLDYLHALPALVGAHLQRTLEAALPDDRDRKLLGAERGIAILQLTRIVHSADGAPIEYLYSRFRGDRFKYRISV
jgi:GntR family transcriptional regulator